MCHLSTSRDRWLQTIWIKEILAILVVHVWNHHPPKNIYIYNYIYILLVYKYIDILVYIIMKSSSYLIVSCHHIIPIFKNPVTKGIWANYYNSWTWIKRIWGQKIPDPKHHHVRGGQPAETVAKKFAQKGLFPSPLTCRESSDVCRSKQHCLQGIRRKLRKFGLHLGTVGQ